MMKINNIITSPYSISPQKTDNKKPDTRFSSVKFADLPYYKPLNITFKGSCIENDVSNFLSQNPKPVAQGLKGKVYKFNNFAVKVAKENRFNFDSEAEILKKLPQNLSGGQKFVAYFKDNEGKSVLVSNFVSGKSETLNSQSFDKFFDVILKHDKAGILHGDINKGNWMFDNENNINLIDYGESRLFDVNDDKSELYPDFIATSNVINLEHNGIPDCIKDWNNNNQDCKRLFTDYLKSKSEFYEKHVSLVEGNASHKDYETNMAKVLFNPSQRVLQNEINRIDTLYSFESADTSVNYTNKPKEAIFRWQNTVAHAKSFKTNIEKQLSKEDLPQDERTYFEYQNKISDNFIEKFSDWGQGTIDWLYGLKSRPSSELSQHERTLKENWDKPEDLEELIPLSRMVE